MSLKNDDFEDFHIVAVEAISNRVADLLKRNGVRIEQRVITEIGRPEFVIAVHTGDIDLASDIFRNEVGPGRIFTSESE